MTDILLYGDISHWLYWWFYHKPSQIQFLPFKRSSLTHLSNQKHKSCLNHRKKKLLPPLKSKTQSWCFVCSPSNEASQVCTGELIAFHQTSRFFLPSCPRFFALTPSPFQSRCFRCRILYLPVFSKQILNFLGLGSPPAVQQLIEACPRSSATVWSEHEKQNCAHM